MCLDCRLRECDDSVDGVCLCCCHDIEYEPVYDEQPMDDGVD